MNGNVLLDTNIVIAFFAQDPTVLREMQAASQFFIPTIVLGELYFGAEKSNQAAQNIKRIDELAKSTAILGCNVETARQYGELKNQLRQRGRPLPENDVWIAALALQHNLTLITRDAHFQHVESLSLTPW
jgi:tRNA(fMet)-specific endonuclease VapC